MWSASLVLIERTIDSRSMTLAVIGMCSLICMSPAVEIGRNGPPVGAPGLRSQMSMVDGPPLIHSKIAALRFRFRSAAWVRKLLVSERTGIVMAEAPARCDRKCRRDIPDGIETFMVVS